MGLLDDLFAQTTQSGELSKSASSALGELLRGGGSPGARPEPNQDLSDGLANLIDKLRRGGLDDIVNSWIGTGQNRPVDPGALKSALGVNTVDKMANDTGTSVNDLLNELVKALPAFIDKLTPDGKMPGPGSR